MKRIISIIAALVLAAGSVLMAQTPEEIISRMEKEMNAHEKDGIFMVVEMKLPILGTFATETYTKGDKMRMEVNTSGKKAITWIDGRVQWLYTVADNEVVIENLKQDGSKSSEGDLSALNGIADGYDVSLSKETDKEWYLLCKKSRSNKDKDAPKSMNLVVWKDSYLPASFSGKMSGVTLTMRNLKFGVSDREVTFNAADYPGVKITDKRSAE
ncbi:MAG: hypothetical protein J6O51_01830 [Bacteroidales bacterium]|nr:hypothetical protein [Bacteroidales bacterium]